MFTVEVMDSTRVATRKYVNNSEVFAISIS